MVITICWYPQGGWGRLYDLAGMIGWISLWMSEWGIAWNRHELDDLKKKWEKERNDRER